MCVPLDCRRRASRRRRKVAAGSTTFPPPDRSGAVPPVGHSQFPLALSSGSTTSAPAVGTPAARRCLLKGCERWFLPHQPQARYCSPACQHAARRWRRWHASQRYRATTNGKQHRRDQARRYRNRGTASLPLPEPALPTPEVEPLTPVIDAEPPSRPTRQLPSPPPARASAQTKFRKILWACPATGQAATSFSSPRRVPPSKHFCSCSCRQALRRVRQREARLRQRRRRGGRPRRRHRGPP